MPRYRQRCARRSFLTSIMTLASCRAQSVPADRVVDIVLRRIGLVVADDERLDRAGVASALRRRSVGRGGPDDACMPGPRDATIERREGMNGDEQGSARPARRRSSRMRVERGMERSPDRSDPVLACLRRQVAVAWDRRSSRIASRSRRAGRGNGCSRSPAANSAAARGLRQCAPQSRRRVRRRRDRRRCGARDRRAEAKGAERPRQTIGGMLTDDNESPVAVTHVNGRLFVEPEQRAHSPIPGAERSQVWRQSRNSA